MKKLIRKLITLFKVYILRDRFLLAHKKWVKDNGDGTLRLNYNLSDSSIVFDLGGYHGEFAEKIFNKYQCTVYVFEPVKKHSEMIKNKFIDNPKIKVFNFGLSDKDEEIEIILKDDASSTFLQEGYKENIQLKSISTFLEKEHFTSIDLMKINIEGGEFAILPELIKKKTIEYIKNLQIQFHDFIPNAHQQREHIRNNLSLTHDLTYDYYFVWENWTLHE